MLYLLTVLISAIYGGYTAALLAAVLSALAYNFFFIEPVHTFTIASPHEVFGLLIFIVAALIAGGLASRLSDQATSASYRAASTQSLYDFSRKLSGTVNADDVIWAAVTQVQATLKRDVVCALAVRRRAVAGAAWPPDTDLDVTDMTAARWAIDKKRTGRQRHRHAAQQRIPVPSARRADGVGSGHRLSPGQGAS